MINFTGNENVQKLYIANTCMPNGTYGRTSTGANNGGLGVGALDAYFGTTGNGKWIVLDNTAPTLASIADDKAGAPVQVDTLITYTVTFSDDMDARPWMPPTSATREPRPSPSARSPN